MAARRMFRTLLTLLIASAWCLFTVSTAQAGGPTSALLVSPGTDRAAALYYSDAEYQRLNTLLGGDSPQRDPAASAASHSGGNYVTVTWLIHDVSVWRIDRIFLGAADGPWIVTQMVDGSSAGMYPGEAGDETSVTHRSPEPAALKSLLTSIGLLGPRLGQPAGGSDADAAPIAASQRLDGSASAAAPVDARAGAPWWWLLAGLVAGMLITATAVRFLPAARSRLSDPTADDELVRMTPLSG